MVITMRRKKAAKAASMDTRKDIKRDPKPLDIIIKRIKVRKCWGFDVLADLTY